MTKQDQKCKRVLFLYNNERSSAFKLVQQGKNHGGGFWGLAHLDRFGITAEFLEIEQFVSQTYARFIREKILRSVYFVHVPFFFAMFKYDVVFTQASYALQLLHTLYPFKKPKWVMHDFNIRNLIGDCKTIRQKIFFWMVSHCDGIVTLSRPEADRLKKWFPHLKDTIKFLPFGVDVNFFESSSATKTQTVFAAGRDIDRDWKILFEAASRIPAKIIIATKEERVSHLRPFPNNVEVGQFEIDTFKKHYEEACVFVLPLNTSKNTNDAMGCSVLYEALAVGKAIIVTETETTASYIQNGVNGLLVKEGNVNSLVDAINRLLEDPELQKKYEKTARNYAVSNLEIMQQTKKLAQFFQAVCKE